VTESLAARLNVSPTPVREALVHLERTGLVTREGFKGYRVAEPLSEQQMTELVDAREMLEVQATRWAVNSLPEMLPDLRAAHAQHAAATAEVLGRLQTERVDLRTYRQYFDADEAFHKVIMRFADNRFLAQMASDLGAHQHRMRQTIIHREYDVAQALAEHAAILAAAEALDADAVVGAMQDHMNGLRSRSVGGIHSDVTAVS
jgi:DNA-binding GntR family transcriptional regulator